MYKLKSESDCVNWDNMVVEEADKKLVKEYNDFLKFSSVRFKI